MRSGRSSALSSWRAAAFVAVRLGASRGGGVVDRAARLRGEPGDRSAQARAPRRRGGGTGRARAGTPASLPRRARAARPRSKRSRSPRRSRAGSSYACSGRSSSAGSRATWTRSSTAAGPRRARTSRTRAQAGRRCLHGRGARDETCRDRPRCDPRRPQRGLPSGRAGLPEPERASGLGVRHERGRPRRAFAELLRRDGHAVARLRERPRELELDPARTTLVLADAGIVEDEDAKALRRFVERGGRLLAAGPAFGWLGNLVEPAPVWGSGTPWQQVRVARAATGARRDPTGSSGAAGSWEEAGATLPLLGDGRGRPSERRADRRRARRSCSPIPAAPERGARPRRQRRARARRSPGRRRAGLPS